MSGLSKNQILIVVSIGVVALTVMLLLCVAVAFGLRNLSEGRVALPPTPMPTNTPTPTPFPTWTPTPTSTPYPTALPTRTPAPTATPVFLSLEDEEMLDQIELEVSALRGLEPLRPVPRWAITRAELRTYYVEPILDEHWEGKLDSLTHVLVAFDLMQPGVDLAFLLEYYLPQSIAGFYDPMTGGIYIVSDTGTLDAYDYVVFAHEYGHALQDQHFDLLSLGYDEFGFAFDHLDRFNAIRALVEGDAELIEDRYQGAALSGGEMADASSTCAWQLWPAALHPNGIDHCTQTPPIDDVFRFPYAYGERFVRDLYSRGSWEAVNDAYADSPASTEQILHPERYWAGDEPVLVSVAPLTDTLGSEWHLTFEDPVGEFMLGVYLQVQLSADEAAVAADGWGGDLGVVYYDGTNDELVMVLHSVWDTPAEAEEFLDAYMTYATRRYGYPANETSAGLSCWYGDDVLCVTWGGDWVTIVLGPDQATVEDVLIAVSE
jgi:hypothetical protein